MTVQHRGFDLPDGRTLRVGMISFSVPKIEPVLEYLVDGSKVSPAEGERLLRSIGEWPIATG